MFSCKVVSIGICRMKKDLLLLMFIHLNFDISKYSRNFVAVCELGRYPLIITSLAAAVIAVSNITCEADRISEQIMPLSYSLPYFDMAPATISTCLIIPFSSPHIICYPVGYVALLVIVGTCADLGSGYNLIWYLYLSCRGTANMDLMKYICTAILWYIYIYIYIYVCVCDINSSQLHSTPDAAPCAFRFRNFIIHLSGRGWHLIYVRTSGSHLPFYVHGTLIGCTEKI